MGSPRIEKNRGDDEGPLHRVCLNSFWISENEITVMQFEKFVHQAKYQTQAEKDGFSWTYDGKWKKRGGIHWKNPGFKQTQHHPVIHVTYNDALAMAQWLSSSNKRFSLPTEAQWEYACRAQSNSSRFFGDNIGRTCQYANVADQSIKQKYHAWTVHPCNDTFIYTAPVRTFSPNPFGLYDMLGNVWEWCINAYDHRAYLHPINKYTVHNNQTQVSIRGGSWYTRPQYLRCANRDFVASCTRRSSDLGFRLIMN
jgi:formylglycine-generating enzyme required for sulfatase activity